MTSPERTERRCRAMNKRQIKSRIKALCEALKAAQKDGNAARAFSMRTDIEYLEFMYRAV